MRPILGCLVALLLLISPGLVSQLNAEPAEKRIALVIGNATYPAGALQTSANDAGLIAQTLQAAGFDVVGARDLDQDSLRRAFRDFLEKATNSGPDTVALVFLSGYGLQLEGENYFVPVDAKIGRDADVAAEAVRVSDYIRSLGALKLKASIVVLDAARRNPFSLAGQPLAGGLALVEPSPGMLVAFNAAPGTIAPEQTGSYGAYAHALAEMIREGGLPLGELFDRVRLRVNDVTKGAQVPWNASRVNTSFAFFERSPDAPAPVASADQLSTIRSRPIRDLGAQDAYAAALERDTLQGYEEFLAAYPDDPMARRVRAIIAARREAITWRRTYAADTPDAYWSYLRRYPHGPHGADARRRLALRAAALEPPPAFAPIDYDVPPPPPEEVVYVERVVLVFDDPDFDFAPPPPPPIYFLPPPPPDFIVLEAPPPPFEIFVLPIPVFIPIPVWCHPPVYLAPPPSNVIFNNIHNTVIINNITKVVTVKNQSGQVLSSGPRPTLGAGVVTLGASLPPSVAKKAALIQPQGSGLTPTAPAQRSSTLPLGKPLPGIGGHPLPPLPGKPPSGGVTSSQKLNTPHPATPPPGTDRKRAPLSTTIRTPPTSPAATIRQTPPSAGRFPSRTVNRPSPPPPPVVARPAPSPRTTYRPPATAYRPPAAAYRPPPPTAYHPPAAIYRPPPPTAYRPPPPAVRAAPPPVYRPPSPAVHAGPPPSAVYRPPPPARKTCQVVNGHPVCR